MTRIELLIFVLTVFGVQCEYLLPVNQNGESRFNLTSLKFVSVIARHGSRSPLSTFPTDLYPYTDLSYWPDGVGRLTKAGKNQVFEMGKNLKSRYRGFLNSQYRDNETLFLSNAMDRDLASSQLMAAGMYPPSGFEIWNPDLLWQPIAVWISDYDVVDTDSDCPKFKVEKEKALDNLYQEIFPQYESFFNQIANFTGLLPSEVWSNLYPVWQLPLLREENGFPGFAWQDKTFRDQLFYPTAKRYQAEVVGTPTMTSLMAGPVLEPLVLQLNNKARGTLNPDRKIFTLAAHDTTIVAAVGGLGIDELLIPDTASYLVFELHDSAEGDIVQILYFNRSTTLVPTLLKMPQCPHPCPLATFIQVAQRTIENSERSNCIVEGQSLPYTSSGSLPSHSLPSLPFTTICVFMSVIYAQGLSLNGWRFFTKHSF